LPVNKYKVFRFNLVNRNNVATRNNVAIQLGPFQRDDQKDSKDK